VKITHLTDLRKLARGHECMVRFVGVCNRNPETTVLAHIKNGWYGSIKPPDVMAVFACSSCHDEMDRRTQRLSDDAMNLDLFRAFLRQVAWYAQHEVILW